MHERPHRFALALLLGLLVASAGCSAIDGGDDATQIRLVDQDNDDNVVLVEILDGQSVVFSAGRTTDGETGADLGVVNLSGEFTVRVTVDGESTEVTRQLPDDDATITIGLHDDKPVSIY